MSTPSRFLLALFALTWCFATACDGPPPFVRRISDGGVDAQALSLQLLAFDGNQRLYPLENLPRKPRLQLLGCNDCQVFLVPLSESIATTVSVSKHDSWVLAGRKLHLNSEGAAVVPEARRAGTAEKAVVLGQGNSSSFKVAAVFDLRYGEGLELGVSVVETIPSHNDILRAPLQRVLIRTDGKLATLGELCVTTETKQCMPVQRLEHCSIDSECFAATLISPIEVPTQIRFEWKDARDALGDSLGLQSSFYIADVFIDSSCPSGWESFSMGCAAWFDDSILVQRQNAAGSLNGWRCGASNEPDDGVNVWNFFSSSAHRPVRIPLRSIPSVGANLRCFYGAEDHSGSFAERVHNIAFGRPIAVHIVEVRVDPDGTDTGREYLVIRNFGTETVDLASLELRNDLSDFTIPLPELPLPSGASIVIAGQPANGFLDELPALPRLLLADFERLALMRNGRRVILKMAVGRVISSFVLPDPKGQSNPSGCVSSTRLPPYRYMLENDVANAPCTL